MKLMEFIFICIILLSLFQMIMGMVTGMPAMEQNILFIKATVCLIYLIVYQKLVEK